MITFIKEDLEFLNMYASVSDAKKDDISVYGRILFTANKETGKVMFAQSSIEAEMITEFDKRVDTSFQIILPTVTITNLIKQLPNESEVSFKEDGIYFNSNKYAFEQHDITFINYEDYLDIAKKTETSFTLLDIEKFMLSRNFMGHDVDQIDAVALNKGYFVSSNGGDAVTSIIKTTNYEEHEFNSSKTLINILTTNKKKQIDIAFYSNEESEEHLSIVEINNTYVILKEKEYFLPPVFEKEFKDVYDHKNYIKVNKKDFLNVFNRIKLFTNDAYNYRFHLKCNTSDTIELETKDENYACEKFNAEVSKELVGKTLTLSAQYLGLIIKDIIGDYIYFYASSNCDYAEESEMEGCKIQDENADNFYITILLEGN